MKPRRLVHSLGDARPLPRPGFKVVLCTFFFSAEQKKENLFFIFFDLSPLGLDKQAH